MTACIISKHWEQQTAESSMTSCPLSYPFTRSFISAQTWSENTHASYQSVYAFAFASKSLAVFCHPRTRTVPHITHVNTTWMSHSLRITRTVPHLTHVNTTWMPHSLQITRTVPHLTHVNTTWMPHSLRIRTYHTSARPATLIKVYIQWTSTNTIRTDL